MGAKRALIVDDSRSARAFLSRILEKYEIDVDAAESAEQAIEYLGHHRPDVIFMDHQMPGMDGFQAVQVIKNNPRTAMIPIMMYTSQEGELFLGQARALGAVGVLPKQIKPADVSKVLYELHLVPERRTDEQSTFRPILVSTGSHPVGVSSNTANFNSVEIISAHDENPPPPPSPPSTAGKPLTEGAMREMFADLRRALVSSLDSQTDRISADVRHMLHETQPSSGLIADLAVPRRAPQRKPWSWVIAAVAAIFAVALGALLWQAFDQQRELKAELLNLRETAQTSGAPAAPSALELNDDAVVPARSQSTAARVRSATNDSKPIIEVIPYGSEALAGPRLEVTRQLFNRLSAQNHHGVVDIKVFAGRFCLIGNASEGFSLPPDETPYSKCDLVAAPLDDSVSPAERMPIAYANLIGAFRMATRGNVQVQVSSGEPSVTVTPYPQVTDTLTAGEWNRAGSANNRVEIRVR
jgi:CheY-like chemotaxis protein